MRKIKFRAWDNVTERMFRVENIDFRQGYISLNEGDNSLTDTFEMIEIMQYTGRKDMDDKEVYEGDILVRDGHWSMRVLFEDGAFIIKDLEPVRYINNCTRISLHEFPLSNWRVAGNIFENKELLEDKDFLSGLK